MKHANHALSPPSLTPVRPMHDTCKKEDLNGRDASCMFGEYNKGIATAPPLNLSIPILFMFMSSLSLFESSSFPLWVFLLYIYMFVQCIAPHYTHHTLISASHSRTPDRVFLCFIFFLLFGTV